VSNEFPTFLVNDNAAGGHTLTAVYPHGCSIAMPGSLDQIEAAAQQILAEVALQRAVEVDSEREEL